MLEVFYKLCETSPKKHIIKDVTYYFNWNTLVLCTTLNYHTPFSNLFSYVIRIISIINFYNLFRFKLWNGFHVWITN